MDIHEAYAELLAGGFSEGEAARLVEELYAPLPGVYREVSVLGALMVVAGALLCVVLTIGGL